MTARKANERWDELMQAALAGDAAAYRTLFEELTRGVRVIAAAAIRRTGQGNADVEDIVQETLLAIHLKRHTWDPARPFAPWVRAIAHHKVIDALRRKRITLPIGELEDTLPAPETHASDLGDAERLLARLSERQQAIVRLVSIEGQSSTAAASQLGMSEGALRVALHRALKALAELYRKGAS